MARSATMLAVMLALAPPSPSAIRDVYDSFDVDGVLAMDHLEGESRLRERSLHGALYDTGDKVDFLSEILGNRWVQARIISVDAFVDGLKNPYDDLEQVRVQYFPDGSPVPIQTEWIGSEGSKIAPFGSHQHALDCLTEHVELRGEPGSFKGGDVVRITSGLHKGKEGTVINWALAAGSRWKWTVQLTDNSAVQISAANMEMVTPLSIPQRGAPPQVSQSAVDSPQPVQQHQAKDFKHGDVVEILSGDYRGRQVKIMAPALPSTGSKPRWVVKLGDHETVEVDGEDLRFIKYAEIPTA